MGFERGNKYSKGRPKGTPNKKTEQWQVFSDYCVNGGLKKFKNELGKLEGTAYVKVFVKLLEFFKPKLSRVAMENTEDTKMYDDIFDRLCNDPHGEPYLKRIAEGEDAKKVLNEYQTLQLKNEVEYVFER